MTVKEVKYRYKFCHIFINGDELYHKDNSVNNREVKSIKEKNTFSVVKRYMCQYRKVNGYFIRRKAGKKL